MNNKKTLIGPVLYLICAMALSVTAIFAWLTSDNNPGMGNFNLNVSNSKILNSAIETYAVSAVEMNGNSEAVNFTLATEGNGLIPLTDIPMYETLSSNNSLFKYKPVLAVRITFRLGENSQCSLNVFTEKDFILGGSNWLSNGTSFSVAEYDEENQKLNVQGQPLSFVDLAAGEIQKPAKNINILNNAFSQGENSVWIIIQYKSEIIDIIHQANMTAERIEYKNDIYFEII